MSRMGDGWALFFIVGLVFPALLVVCGAAIQVWDRVSEWRNARAEAAERKRWEEMMSDTSELRPCDIVFLQQTEQWKAMHGKDQDAA